MVQPKSAPLGVRLSPSTITKVEAFAAANKVSRHSALVMLIERGLKLTAPAKSPSPQTYTIPPKTNKAVKAALADPPKLDLPLGPQPIKPGDRLKKR